MVKQPAPPRPPEMPLEHQKFLAFEHLLGWTAAVIAQSERITEARNALLATHKEGAEQAQKDPEQWGKTLWKEHELACRLASERFQTERHLFCNAAFKLLEYSQWVRQLGLLDDATFVDLDLFADDIKVMRDKNVHEIEYFKGRGLHPQDWEYESAATGRVDASATFETKIGGRLDWVVLGDLARHLFGHFRGLGPFTPRLKP